jgi:predicted double-glycine peptidase
VLVLAIAGCATLPRATSPRAAPAAEPLRVPFIAQKPGYCGPAALAMLANHYGYALTQDEIAGEIYLPQIRGVLTAELAGYATRLNLWVRQYRGSPEDLRAKLRAGVPLIVLGKPGGRYHYFVVLAMDEFRGTVTVHSDTRAHLELSREQFLRWWGAAGRWTLLVCPPERVNWRLTAEEHNDLGLFQERGGRLAEAAGHYRFAAALRPANSYYSLNLGNVLLKQGLIAEAAAAYARAVQAEPDNADALNNLAYAWLQLGGNLEQAAALCRRAIQLRPARRAWYLDTLGSILLRQGKTTEAIAVFESAMDAAGPRASALRDGIAQRLAAARALGEK